MTQSLETQVKAILGPDTFANLFPDSKRTDATGPQLVSVDDITVLQDGRRSDTEEAQKSRKRWYYTGDTGNYGIEDNGDVTVCIADFANHPAPVKDGQKDFAAFASAVMGKGYFFDGSNLEAKATQPNSGVVKVNLSILQCAGLLLGNDEEWSYVQLSTELLAKGRGKFREFYESQNYGQGVDSNKVADEMVRLVDATHGSAIYGKRGIAAKLFAEQKDNTNIGVLAVDYVKNNLKNQVKGTKLARASRLDDFGNHSVVDLVGRDLDDHRFVRGVVREKVAAEGGDAQKTPA